MVIPQVMIQIVQLGGNLTIDLDKQIVIPQIMMQLAQAAASSGSIVTFKNFDGKIIPQVLFEVSRIGRGNVTFEQ